MEQRLLPGEKQAEKENAVIQSFVDTDKHKNSDPMFWKPVSPILEPDKLRFTIICTSDLKVNIIYLQLYDALYAERFQTIEEKEYFEKTMESEHHFYSKVKRNARWATFQHLFTVNAKL